MMLLNYMDHYNTPSSNQSPGNLSSTNHRGVVRQSNVYVPKPLCAVKCLVAFEVWSFDYIYVFTDIALK